MEFCGGTHLQNTRDAEAFVITEETAVAKGIRRISAITGEAARSAKITGERLAKNVEELYGTMGANSLSVQDMEGEIGEIRTKLEEETISMIMKSHLRTQLEKIQKDIFSMKKAAMMSKVTDGIKRAKVVYICNTASITFGPNS